MLKVLNFSCYMAASFAACWLYVRSVSPAQLERRIGEKAYTRCARYRTGSIILMLIAMINFVLVRSFPFTRCIPGKFSLPEWLSFSFAVIIAVPSLALMITGMQGIGGETLAPNKRNKLVHKGIYAHIRHPQAYEALLWPAVAFGLHSPLLLILSLPWLLLEAIMVMAEDLDLVVRFGETYLKYKEKTPAFLPINDMDLGVFNEIGDRLSDLFSRQG